MSLLERITYWRKQYGLRVRFRKMIENGGELSEKMINNLFTEFCQLESSSRRKLPMYILKHKVNQISKKFGLSYTSAHLHEILYKVSKLDIGQVLYANSTDFKSALFDSLRSNTQVITSDGLEIIERDNPFLMDFH